jgi:hypothetical protein
MEAGEGWEDGKRLAKRADGFVVREQERAVLRLLCRCCKRIVRWVLEVEDPNSTGTIATRIKNDCENLRPCFSK